MSNVVSINKLKYEKQYREFYKFASIDLRLDNVSRNGDKLNNENTAIKLLRSAK